MSTELKEVWNSIYDLELQQAITQWHIAKMEAELKETELYKKIQEWKKWLSTLEEQIEAAKMLVLQKLKDMWIKKIETDHQRITIWKTPWAINVINEAEIPDNYFKEKVERKLDKKALKEWLNLWDVVPGAEIVYKDKITITPLG